MTPSTADNGCLRFIPGSHRTDDPGVHDSTLRPGEMFSGSLDPASFDETTKVDVELESGQFVIFDVYTIHGSLPDNGPLPRAADVCRYMPGVRDRPGYGHESRAPMLVRGEDRTGRNDFG